MTEEKNANSDGSDRYGELSGAEDARGGPPKIEFTDVAQGSAVVLIHCDGQVYQLRRTKNGKLLLHK